MQHVIAVAGQNRPLPILTPTATKLFAARRTTQVPRAAADTANAASADFSLHWSRDQRHPFRRKARSPRVRTSAFAARPPDLRRLALVTRVFAVCCPLALLGSASYPVSVRRPAASLPASFTPASRNDALQFASLAVTSSREDFHLQVDAHAGRNRHRGAEVQASASPATPPGMRVRTGRFNGLR